METQVAERIRKEVSTTGLSVSRVYNSDYQKEGTQTAELRQTVTTKSYYPSKSVSNNMQDNIFGASEFGFEEQEYVNNENRVAWIDVPMNTTPEQVLEKLKSFPNANLFRVLSNEPILTDNQVYAIKEGLTTKDVFANRQVVRFPEGAKDDAGADIGGQIALDPNGKPQYRSIFFSNTGKADMDKRTDDEHYYASQEIADELSIVENNVMSGQSLS